MPVSPCPRSGEIVHNCVAKFMGERKPLTISRSCAINKKHPWEARHITTHCIQHRSPEVSSNHNAAGILDGFGQIPYGPWWHVPISTNGSCDVGNGAVELVRIYSRNIVTFDFDGLKQPSDVNHADVHLRIESAKQAGGGRLALTVQELAGARTYSLTQPKESVGIVECFDQ